MTPTQIGTEGEGETKGKEERTHIVRGDIERKVGPKYTVKTAEWLYTDIYKYIYNCYMRKYMYLYKVKQGLLQ